MGLCLYMQSNFIWNPFYLAKFFRGDNWNLTLFSLRHSSHVIQMCPLFIYSADLKPGHSKSRLFDDQISNGQASIMIPNIWNLDFSLEFQSVSDKMAAIFLDFKSRSHFKSRPFLNWHTFNYSKSRRIQIWDPHCSSIKRFICITLFPKTTCAWLTWVMKFLFYR